MSTPTTPFYPMTHDDAQELIAAIGDESKLAQAYDSTRTYTKDEHCIYSGKLYKCISTISTAEAWTAAHWEEATVGDELTEHKKDIDAICQTVTGANNNTGHTINSGEYFIANGAKYKANAAIPNGEPWASSADPVSDHDLINALNNKLTIRPIAVNIPQSGFTWDDTYKAFKKTGVTAASLGLSTIIGFLVTAKNGTAVMGAYINASNQLYVYGIIPLIGESIGNDYTFNCYAFGF